MFVGDSDSNIYHSRPKRKIKTQTANISCNTLYILVELLREKNNNIDAIFLQYLKIKLLSLLVIEVSL